MNAQDKLMVDGRGVDGPMNATTLHCPTPPPTDGSPFLCHANIAYDCGAWHVVDSEFGRMRFSASGELVWERTGMSVRQFAHAEVHLLEWRPFPKAAVPFAVLRAPSAQPAYDHFDDGGDW